MSYLSWKSLALAAGMLLAVSGPSESQVAGGGGSSYTAGSGLTLTGSQFTLGDANLSYSAGALATTSLALGGATLGGE